MLSIAETPAQAYAVGPVSEAVDHDVFCQRGGAVGLRQAHREHAVSLHLLQPEPR